MGYEYDWEELDAREEFPYLFGDNLWLEKKTCRRCGQSKILNEFNTDSSSIDGIGETCKPCVAAIQKEKYYADIEKSRAKGRAANRKSYKENPEKARARGLRRRAFMTGAEGTATAKQIKGRWDLYGSLCYLCGKPAEQTDHVIPISKGGTNWPANLRPICKTCNSSKRARWPYAAAFNTNLQNIGQMAY